MEAPGHKDGGLGVGSLHSLIRGTEVINGTGSPECRHALFPPACLFYTLIFLILTHQVRLRLL